MSSKRAGKRAASARTGRRKLGLTRSSVRDLPPGDRQASSVKGGGVKKVLTTGNDQPQSQ